jgi:peptide/nickel transport system substrate-binding protein
LPKDKTYGYDPTRAKQLLAEAGYPNGFSTTVWVPQSGSGMMQPVEMSQFMQRNLADVGINVKLQTFEWTSFLSEIVKNGAPTGKGVGMVNDSLGTDPPYSLKRLFGSAYQPPAGWNFGWYANPAVDRLLENAAAEPDQAKRNSAYSQAEEIAVEEVAWVLVAHDKAPRAWRTYVQGFRPAHSWNFGFQRTWLDK